MWQDKKGMVLKLFIMLTLVVVVQSFLQNGAEIQNILSTIMGYITPFIYGAFIAILLQPLAKLFEEKWKMKREIAISLSVISVVVICIFLVSAVIPGVAASIRQLTEKMPEYEAKSKLLISQGIHFIEAKGITVISADELKLKIDGFLSANKDLLTSIFKSLSLNIISMSLKFGQILIGLLIAIYFINEREYFSKLIKNIMFLLSNNEKAEEGMKFLEESRVLFLNYMWGKTLASLGVAIIALIIMLFGKVPYAVLIAILMGFGNMIPYVGLLIVMIIGIVFVGIADPTKIIYLVAANIISNQIEGFILTPMIVGKTVGLSSFWVITGVLLGGAIMGPLGMILGVPVIGIIKIIYRNRMQKKLKNMNQEMCNE